MSKLKAGLVLSLAMMLSACGDGTPAANESITTEASGTTTELTPLESAIIEAKKQQDYRLYYSQGRRMTVPGLEQQAIEPLKMRCGLKAMKATGDVLKSVEQKQQRQANYLFAKQFNLAMLPICMNNKSA